MGAAVMGIGGDVATRDSRFPGRKTGAVWFSAVEPNAGADSFASGVGTEDEVNTEAGGVLKKPELVEELAGNGAGFELRAVVWPNPETPNEGCDTLDEIDEGATCG